MANEFKTELSALYKLAFGLTGKLIALPEVSKALEQVQAPDIVFAGIDEYVPEDYEMYSSLGTPVLFPIKFKNGNYRYYKQDGSIGTKKMADFLLPITSVCDFSQPKIIGKSTIGSHNGSVKETFGFDDWQITIRGICLNDNAHPQAKDYLDQHDIINAWKDLADSIEVDGELFARKGISRLVIEEVNWKQVAGRPYWLPFELRCISENAIELI